MDHVCRLCRVLRQVSLLSAGCAFHTEARAGPRLHTIRARSRCACCCSREGTRSWWASAAAASAAWRAWRRTSAGAASLRSPPRAATGRQSCGPTWLRCCARQAWPASRRRSCALTPRLRTTPGWNPSTTSSAQVRTAAGHRAGRRREAPPAHVRARHAWHHPAQQTGGIPSLLTAQELEACIADVRGQVEAAGGDTSREACCALFAQRLQDNLHVVLTMSPVGDAFRTRFAPHGSFARQSEVLGARQGHHTPSHTAAPPAAGAGAASSPPSSTASRWTGSATGGLIVGCVHLAPYVLHGGAQDQPATCPRTQA
jgi:hypothetical protein